MQTVQWDFGKVPSGTSANIYILGDLHIGHVGCHKNLVRQHVKRIASDPSAHVCLVGDILDSIGLTDKRFSLSQLDPEIIGKKRDDIVAQQIDMAYDLLGPIANKIRIVLIGNHEWAYCAHSGGVDPLRILVERLNLSDPPPNCAVNKPYMAAYSGYLRLRWLNEIGSSKSNDRHWRVDLSLHHGAGGGRKPGAKVNGLDDRAGWWPTADIVASGHNHARTMHERAGIAMAERCLSEEQRVQICFNTGSYLRTYFQDCEGSHYGERADYPPSALGGVVAKVTMLRDEHEGKTRRYVTLAGGFL